MTYLDYVGENVESFFTRVAVLGFEKSVLKALEKSEQSKSSSNDLIRQSSSLPRLGHNFFFFC